MIQHKLIYSYKSSNLETKEKNHIIILINGKNKFVKVGYRIISKVCHKLNRKILP